MKPQTLKGFRDIDPEEALKRGGVLSLLKSVFKSYGFQPLETPTLEYAEVLEGKYGGEADKLIYKFKDRGGRAAALRYDLTVPLARYIAQNKGKITFPFKRYQIGSVFRAEKPQAGRYREFAQVDIDTVGVDTALADAEILAVISSSLEILGVKNFKILVNDRDLFNELPKKAVLILDKLDKIGKDGIKEELKKAGLDANQILRQAQDKKPTPRLQEIFALLESFGISKANFAFNPLLARGLDYYTGMIFEVKSAGGPVRIAEQSVAGGPVRIAAPARNDMGSVSGEQSVAGGPVRNASVSVAGGPARIAEQSVAGGPARIAEQSVAGGPVRIAEQSVADGPARIAEQSVAGGGRYDNMIGIFGKEKIPAVGGSFGLDRLIDEVPEETLAEIPFRPQVLVTVFSKELLAPTIELFDQVQGTGVEAELYLDPTAKLAKQLKYADKKSVRYALILGPEEVKNRRVTVKDLQKRTQETLGGNDLLTLLKSS